MSEAKHTPLPWETGKLLRECDGHTSNYFTEQVDVYPPTAGPGEEQHGGPIAVFSMGECGEANLALFMAAPDLLAACKELVGQLAQLCEVNKINSPSCKEAIAMGEAAIAKVEGVEQ